MPMAARLRVLSAQPLPPRASACYLVSYIVEARKPQKHNNSAGTISCRPLYKSMPKSYGRSVVPLGFRTCSSHDPQHCCFFSGRGRICNSDCHWRLIDRHHIFAILCTQASPSRSHCLSFASQIILSPHAPHSSRMVPKS